MSIESGRCTDVSRDHRVAAESGSDFGILNNFRSFIKLCAIKKSFPRPNIWANYEQNRRAIDERTERVNEGRDCRNTDFEGPDAKQGTIWIVSNEIRDYNSQNCRKAQNHWTDSLNKDSL